MLEIFRIQQKVPDLTIWMRSPGWFMVILTKMNVLCGIPLFQFYCFLVFYIISGCQLLNFSTPKVQKMVETHDNQHGAPPPSPQAKRTCRLCLLSRRRSLSLPTTTAKCQRGPPARERTRPTATTRWKRSERFYYGSL
jgi:hypothetical protein